MLSAKSLRFQIWLGVAAMSVFIAGVASAVTVSQGLRTPSVVLTTEPATGVVHLTFDSAALGHESTVLVWLPDHYQDHGPAWPVAYFLHGELSPGESPRSQVENFALDQLGSDRRFLLVAPDMDTTAACATCVWINGHNGVGVAAESYLMDEVVPLVESVFNVGHDRSQRALLGTSMGGTGALIQGFRHPDRFGFIGALSPVLDLALNPVTDLAGVPTDIGARYDAYLASQGLRPRGAAEIDYRNVSPLDLAPQVISANVDVAITSLKEESSINERAESQLVELGLPHTYISHAGQRFTSDGAMFRSHLLSAMLHVFDDPLPEPATFSYKSADNAFSVWGYDFAVQRQNVEFLDVLGAHRDGTDFILAGRGVVQVRTPAAFTPGRDYNVVMTPDPRSDDPRDPGVKVAPLRPRQVVATADAGGRLAFGADLAPSKVLDETENPAWYSPLVGLPVDEAPHVRVEIAPADVAAADPTSAQSAAGSPWIMQEVLPVPFSAWHVTATPWPSNPQVLTLDFDSPVLGLRARSYVALPDSYFVDDRPFPVLYFLHGTVDGAAPQSAKTQSYNMGFQNRDALARSQYLVVSLDMGDASWCQYCWWTDAFVPKVGLPGRNETIGPYYPPVQAEKHLYQELIPLVQAMFRVRTDRAGRGIIGNSMGGGGAVSNGLRHPDMFGFIGGLSGWHYDWATQGTAEGDIYFNRQGYPSRTESQVWYRNISPYELGTQLSGADVEMIVTSGDGCVDPVNADNYCVHSSSLVTTNPPSTGPASYTAGRESDEVWVLPDTERASKQWAEAGAAHMFGSLKGMHFDPDGEVYSKWYLDRINTTFAKPVPAPFRMSYRSAFPKFSAWGYDFSVVRPNVEFLNVLGARLDGRSFSLAGTGQVTVATPATFKPDHNYWIRATDPDGTSREVAQQSDASGRLTFQVTLGPARTIDEHIELVDAGQFPFPITTVEILDGPSRH